jgi:hypothetical protein
MKAMQDDSGGLENYSACLFSDEQDKLSFLLTGRHQTLRADGGAEKNAVFGGPIFYGHAVQFSERPEMVICQTKTAFGIAGNSKGLLLSGISGDHPTCTPG